MSSTRCFGTTWAGLQPRLALAVEGSDRRRRPRGHRGGRATALAFSAAAFCWLIAIGTNRARAEPSADGSVTERSISPAAVDAGASPTFGDHLVDVPALRQPSRHRLFVMIGGTGTTPATQAAIVRLAAMRGYDAIGLAYPDGDAIAQLCNASTDIECSGRIRQEVITGQNTSPLVQVDHADSLGERLRELLVYLRLKFPGERWGEFLAGDRIAWSRLSVAGHSQGAGHAAYLAKLVGLDRVVMFSGVADVAPNGSTAPWLFRPNVTAVGRIYGFSHLRDPIVPFDVARASWHAMGLDPFGAPALVDGAAPPYGGTHELATDAPSPLGPQRPARFHLSTVVDGATPLTGGGVPVYAPVWAAMAFP